MNSETVIKHTREFVRVTSARFSEVENSRGIQYVCISKIKGVRFVNVMSGGS
uniref:Uncharacterized protein n=1 Tax=Candidatus Kentrum sp. FW TaxID=2126338 RepID=A0A450S1P4_9GAMM|nr:MAG: hypothetical protein BECKFW1821A_GA0114235_101022 [Candidatus Kentron sp. FW]VFJ57159.1 MAG: hypothetical protein BECKFW1821B_GA0114236_103215 [Candidatus Kentron sp. FW]